MFNRLCQKKVLWLLLLASAVLVAVLLAVFLTQPWQPSPPRFARAAVGSNGYECAGIGKEILLKNGSAADAAIATLFCEGVSCAQCMGLGGGFLLTLYDAGAGRVRVLNARETAPAATTVDMFNNQSSTVGGLAVGIPGELRGYAELHAQYGRLPWAELVRPTAELCRRGHHATEYMARALVTYSDRIKNEPSLSEVYINPATGEVWKEGDLIPRPVLARTLDILAEEGPDALHNGSLTDAFVADIQAFGGIITRQDLINYRPVWQEPIEVSLTPDLTLYTNPLPGCGSVMAFILNMLNRWVGGADAPVHSNIYWHRVVETFKFAYAKRTGLGDPPRQNLTFDIEELERNLSNPEWAREYRAQVDDATTYNDWQHYGALFDAPEDHGTAHVVVIAPDGSVVSITSTINYIFGALRRSQSTGILLNNEMDDFAIPNRESAYGMPPSPANMLEAGKRPLSSMVPSLVLNREGLVQLVTGAAGGTKIITQVAMSVIGTLLENTSLAEVVQRPRIHHQLVPMLIEHEVNFDPDVIESLRARGHETTELGPTAGFAAMVAALRDSDGLYVVQTDRRRVGSIDGF